MKNKKNILFSYIVCSVLIFVFVCVFFFGFSQREFPKFVTLFLMVYQCLMRFYD
jgi:hypothetical protein